MIHRKVYKISKCFLKMDDSFFVDADVINIFDIV